MWTYSLDSVWYGIRDCAAQNDSSDVSALGISAMMHGYLAFDKDGELLAPFRTWRNTNTERAAKELTELFKFNIPLRWSIAHLYQAILDNEPHVADIAFVTTLAGYIHWQLTGEKVIGIGDASGMFPIKNGNYDHEMVDKFKELTNVDIFEIFPKVLIAGERAGTLNSFGAGLLGVAENTPLCPPEGDAGTGMVATNSTAPRTGNVSAGTSVFAMVVLEKPLENVYPAIDIVTTPTGEPVAMVHCNECTAKIDPWIKLFGEAFELFGFPTDKGELYQKLYETALGDSKLSEFMRDLLVSAVRDLADGMKLLTEKENVKIDSLTGHGGFFKSGKAGRVIMSETLGIPIELIDNSSEGGAFGMAILAKKIKGRDNEKL
jgi:sugar (pentulose or hexulose) kinase